MRINRLIDEAYTTACAKGWHETPRGIPESLALIHSEVSEALEVYRAGHRPTAVWTEDGKPEGFVVELADIVIRVADLCGELDLDLQKAIREKLKFNKSRPYRHGGKVA